MTLSLMVKKRLNPYEFEILEQIARLVDLVKKIEQMAAVSGHLLI